MVKPIVLNPDPILRERMPDVEWSDDLEDCLQEAFDTLAAEKNGAALAANQIGVRKRFFVIKPSLAESADVPNLIINPRIIRSGKIMSIEKEGCLSFPGVEREVTRPRKVDVEFSFLPMQKKTITLTGKMARIFQHEIDHLDGVLFIDKP
jgi:peptide deformylase